MITTLGMIEIISKLLTTDGSHNAKPVVLKKLENGCIVCVSHKSDSHGYLILCRNGKKVRAHRLVYDHFNGPIPDGLDVCHKCDDPPCLNPEHFFAGTQAENMRDKAEKGRACRHFGNTWAQGEKSGTAKLTAEKVLDIRRKYRSGQYTQAEIGRECGIRQGQISRIVKGKRWKHLEALA